MSLTAIIVITIIGTSLFVAFWPVILDWSRDSLLPWLRANYPQVAELATKALSRMDDVISAVRKSIAEAWQNFRSVLLKLAIYIEKNTEGKWVRRVVSTVRKALDNGQTKLMEITSTKEVDWSELPSEIRERYMKNGQRTCMVDVSKEREAELAI